MAELIEIRPTVLVPLRDSHAFLDVYFNQADMGGVLVPLTTKIKVGDEVELELVFAAEKMVFHARGIARWRRMTAQRSLPAGIGVEFLPSERRARDLLLEFAHGKSVELAQRTARRFPAVIVVEYETDSVFLTDVTDNVSRGGAFIRSQTLPEIGQKLRLKLKPPGYRMGISVDAVVMWRQQGGERSGFGVQFNLERRAARKKIDELIERIKAQLVR